MTTAAVDAACFARIVEEEVLFPHFRLLDSPRFGSGRKVTGVS